MASSGQGIRIRIEIEETNTGKTAKAVRFLSLPVPPTTRMVICFEELLEDIKYDIMAEFKDKFIKDLEDRYSKETI